jgi:hypothetical protein
LAEMLLLLLSLAQTPLPLPLPPLKPSMPITLLPVMLPLVLPPSSKGITLVPCSMSFPSTTFWSRKWREAFGVWTNVRDSVISLLIGLEKNLVKLLGRTCKRSQITSVAEVSHNVLIICVTITRYYIEDAYVKSFLTDKIFP